MKITNIKKMRDYISQNSTLSEKTINSVISSLGYPLNGSGETFQELSLDLVQCAKHGANIGFSGFTYYTETIAFFKKNRNELVSHIESTAEEYGTDIFSMVQNFGVFRNKEKPTPSEIGKALWDKYRIYPELTDLYNVIAWYALEEVSNAWYRYFEENPAYRSELAA